MTDEELLDIQSQVIESICRFTRRAYEDIEEEIDPLVKIIEQQKQEIERLNKFAQMLLGEEWLNERGEYDTKMNRLLKQNKRYREIFEQLYSFEGNVQEHSALADMLCSEVLENK